MVKVAILLRGTDFLLQKEKMVLIENFARNAHTLVMAGDSSGLSSGIASAVKIVKRRITEKECLEQFGRREIEHCLSNNSSPIPFKD